MIVVSSRDFRTNLIEYFKNASGDDFIVKTRDAGSFKVSITPVQKEDAIVSIPIEFRCNPYEVSPSGDPFFADKRNVQEIEKGLQQLEEGKTKKMLPGESLTDFLKRVKK